MPEYSANAVQTIPAGGSAVFTNTLSSCDRGFIMHMDGTPGFELSGWIPNNGCCCPCRKTNYAMYEAFVGANMAVSTGGTAGEITLSISVNGTAIPYSEMDLTPAAAEEFSHVSNQVTVPILAGCCQTLTVTNTSDQPIDVRNLVLKLKRTDLN